MNCKSGKLGCSISICDDCGYSDFHNNSCRNRNCPNCQAVLKELWIDKRKSKAIDTPYFHVVFTVSTELKNKLYTKVWCPDIRETFHGFGNAIKYLGRYTHKITITNTRILHVTPEQVTFIAKDYKNNSATKEVTLSNRKFIRRFMMHVLPSGFQKIRYYGFLNNRSKQKNLTLIFKLQGHQKFRSLYQDLSMPEEKRFNPHTQ